MHSLPWEVSGAVWRSQTTAPATVGEGPGEVTVTLDPDPERRVTIPITKANQGTASDADYSGVPANVVFNSGETEKSITFSATQDTIDDDGESVRLAFGSPLPTDVTAASPQEAVVSITDDDVPSVTVSFGSAAYTVAEGGTVEVTVTLDPDPGRTVTIPITKANQGTASDDDYSGVPANVVFNSGETEKSITFSATQDTIDDDGESVQLGFGVLPTGVSTGGTATSTVSITDDDVPSVTVSFGSAAYTVAEGGTVEVTVTLDPDPERMVTIPITKANQGTASDDDYSGVPANVVFNSGETEKSITFSATQDTIDDDGESVRLAFGSPLPTDVTAASPQEAVVSITDDDTAAGKVTLELTPATINESGTGNASTVTASIPSASSAATTVTVSVNPADTTTLTGNTILTIPAGDTNSTGVVTVTAVNDDAVTGNRTVAVSGTAVNSVGVTDPDDVTLTITDDDTAAGKVTLELTPATINESGTGNASTVTASIPSASSAATTVTVSVNPADTTTLTGNTILTIPAGDTDSTGVVTITAVNDDAYTGNRTVAVSGTAVNSVGVTDPDDVTLTITDDDTAATGDPLVRGERKVGSTLMGDTKGIADPNGLTNPGFNYQWQRMENGMPVDIPGEVSETYTLTDDDVGKRVQLQVRFNDDEGTAEMRTGPATSVITKAPHLLVGNFTRDVRGDINTKLTRVAGFVTGAHEFGYAIDTVSTYRGSFSTPVGDGEVEIRVYDSTSNTNPVERKPKSLIMTADDLTSVRGLILDYSARSRAKLDPDTTYHAALTALVGEGRSCKTAEQSGHDSGSLEGFSIIRRSYSLAAALTTIDFVSGIACAISIKGSELQSSNFLEDVEFTSTPAQEPMYVTGEVIEATATLNQAVTFDGPPPVLLLQIDDNEREMTYVASASTGTSWVFRYTVVADDRDDDGMSFNHYALHGYADADLSNNRVINDGMHRVNAVSQIVSRRVSSKPIAPIWYGPGELIQFTLGFSLPVTVVGDPQLDFNVNLVSLMVTLREEGRLPIRIIQWYLETVHQLHLSVGAIVQAVHGVARQAETAVREVLEQVRASPVVQGDETGWRQDGSNGYVWTFSTPSERYFLRRGRDKGVVDEVLDSSFSRSVGQ